MSPSSIESSLLFLRDITTKVLVKWGLWLYSHVRISIFYCIVHCITVPRDMLISATAKKMFKYVFYVKYVLDLCGDEQLYLGIMTSFNLTSPRYPRQYPLTQDCLWILTTPKDNIAMVEFLHVDTGLDYDKLFIAPIDTKLIFDTDGYFEGVYLLYTGTITPRALVVTEMQFQIAWDPTVWSLTSNTGFALHISLESTSNGTCLILLTLETRQKVFGQL